MPTPKAVRSADCLKCKKAMAAKPEVGLHCQECGLRAMQQALPVKDKNLYKVSVDYQKTKAYKISLEKTRKEK